MLRSLATYIWLALSALVSPVLLVIAARAIFTAHPSEAEARSW